MWEAITGWLKRQRKNPGSLAMLLGLALVPIIFFGLMFLLVTISKFLWIRHVYGYRAYADRLRFVDKRMLSNGDKVLDGVQFVIAFPAFLVAAPVTLIYYGRYRAWANQSYDRYDRA